MPRNAGLVFTGLALFLFAALAEAESLRSIFGIEIKRAGAKYDVARQRGAQLHVESLCNPLAKSKYAEGVAQFTPATRRYIYPKTTPSCAGVPATDPACSIRAQLFYMDLLMRGTRGTYSPWIFALADYNGGAGWRRREQAKCRKTPNCNPRRWFGNVERTCIRAPWACKENRHYPIRIVMVMDRKTRKPCLP